MAACTLAVGWEAELAIVPPSSGLLPEQMTDWVGKVLGEREVKSLVGAVYDWGSWGPSLEFVFRSPDPLPLCWKTIDTIPESGLILDCHLLVWNFWTLRRKKIVAQESNWKLIVLMFVYPTGWFFLFQFFYLFALILFVYLIRVTLYSLFSSSFLALQSYVNHNTHLSVFNLKTVSFLSYCSPPFVLSFPSQLELLPCSYFPLPLSPYP